mmetsp:Transcript_72152/g.215277  ORF Transcript_72152/g.215277 Transcript_72152/m.215277 type:complete len:380 (+) Transcript_72152:657-1796(+)
MLTQVDVSCWLKATPARRSNSWRASTDLETAASGRCLGSSLAAVRSSAGANDEKRARRTCEATSGKMLRVTAMTSCAMFSPSRSQSSQRQSSSQPAAAARRCSTTRSLSEVCSTCFTTGIQKYSRGCLGHLLLLLLCCSPSALSSGASFFCSNAKENMWPTVDVTRIAQVRSMPSAHACLAANSKRGMAREMPRTFRGPERRLGGESAFAIASAMLGFSATISTFRSPSNRAASRDVGPESTAATDSGEKRPRYSKYNRCERNCWSCRMVCCTGSWPTSSPPRKRGCSRSSSRRSSGEGGDGGCQGSSASESRSWPATSSAPSESSSSSSGADSSAAPPASSGRPSSLPSPSSASAAEPSPSALLASSRSRSSSGAESR